METTLESQARELLDKPNFAHVATLRPDGTVHTVVVWVDGQWNTVPSGVDADLRDVITSPGLWIAGDKGTLLTRGASPSELLRKVDLKTDCDLVSLFSRVQDVFVVGRNAAGGGVWRLRDGAVAQHFGGC